MGLVIVRFFLFFFIAKTCHCNNIMAGIMTSKLAFHKAIDAPRSCSLKEGAGAQIRQGEKSYSNNKYE